MNLKKLKVQISEAKKVAEKATKKVWRLVKLCPHRLRPLTNSEWGDEWMSKTAVCEICGRHWEWRCKVSPDGVCHYHSHDGMVELIDGSKCKVPKGHINADETDDSCIYCQMPEERK